MAFPLAAAIWVLCGGLVAWIALAAPYNMDEFVHYHPVACRWFPLAAYNEFRSGCTGTLDLILLGVRLPLRAYRYVGITSSLLYLPVYLAWPDPLGARLTGGLSLLLVALGIARLTGLPATLAVLACLFPIAFALVVDTGPVAFGCALAVWSAVVVRWLLRDAGGWARRIGASGLLGLLLFAGVEQKPFFVLVLPGILAAGLLLALLEDRDRSRLARARLARLLPALGVLGLGCAILFSARTPGGAPYGEILAGAGRALPAFAFGAQMEHFVTSHLADYFLNLTTWGHRLFGWNLSLEPGWTALYWLVLGSLPVAAAALGAQRRLALARAATLVGAAAVTLLLVNRSVLAWGGHHVIFAWLWLVAAACECLAEIWQSGWRWLTGAFLSLLVVAQVGALAATIRQRSAAVSSPELSALHAAIDADPMLSRAGVVASLDWGSYYVKSLYGPYDQLVVFLEPLRREAEARRLVGLARRLGRRLVIVRRRESASDTALLERIVPRLVRREVAGVPDDGEWQLWVEGP